MSVFNQKTSDPTVAAEIYFFKPTFFGSSLLPLTRLTFIRSASRPFSNGSGFSLVVSCAARACVCVIDSLKEALCVCVAVPRRLPRPVGDEQPAAAVVVGRRRRRRGLRRRPRLSVAPQLARLRHQFGLFRFRHDALGAQLRPGNTSAPPPHPPPYPKKSF